MSIYIPLLINLISSPETWQCAPSKVSIRPTPILVVNTYVNNKKRKHRIRAKDITLTSSSRVFIVRDSVGLLVLPSIEKTDTLDLTVKIGHRSASMSRIPGWRLQPGATVIIGRINSSKKAVPLAKQDEVHSTEDNYEVLNNRYEVAAESIIGVPDATRFKYIDYVTLIGYGHGTLITTWRGKLK